MKDLFIGKKFGRLTALEWIQGVNGQKSKWKLECVDVDYI